jgi:hypothetical protein
MPYRSNIRGHSRRLPLFLNTRVHSDIERYIFRVPPMLNFQAERPNVGDFISWLHFHSVFVDADESGDSGDFH